MIAALTPREREVMELVRDGHTNKEIAYKLHLNQRTVEHHMNTAYAKLAADGRRVRAASRYGLFREPPHPDAPRDTHGRFISRKAVQAESLGLELV